MGETSTRLEHTPQKSLRCLTEETSTNCHKNTWNWNHLWQE